MWNKTQLCTLCLDALVVASDAIKKTGSAGKTEVVDGDAVNTSTQADHAVSEALCRFFQQSEIPADLYSEELGKRAHISPQFLIGWDDIDGTENWRRAQGSMPYATIIFVYKGAQPQFKDALVAVVREHISGNIWYAVKGNGCYFRPKGQRLFRRVYTSGETRLCEKTGIRIDSYAMRDSGHTKVARRLMERAWIKDAGSSGYHIASVSNGQADAFVNSACKTHEFGAYLLVTEARGFVSDWQGNSYNLVPVDFNGKYPIVCAATEELGRKIVKLIG
jgi:fructose-1,6-bisphosphatase/inositol monophosphatase family enzyme